MRNVGEKTEFREKILSQGGVRSIFSFYLEDIVTNLKKIKLEADHHTLNLKLKISFNEELFRCGFKVFTQAKPWKEKSHVGGFKTRKCL